MQSFTSVTVLQKQLAAANAALIAASQTPVSGTPLTLTASPVVLDTARRVLVTYGSEAAQRTLTLTGTDPQGSVISETLTIPAGSPGTIPSLRDYATLTKVVPGGGGWTAAMTVGTNTIGSTAWQLPSGYPAIFDLGVQIEITGTVNCSIECTREPFHALPSIYVPGMVFMASAPRVFAWPTLANISADAYSDIDSRVTGYRLTVLSGTGLALATVAPIGLRT